MLRPSIILDELRDGHPGDGLQNIPGDKLLQQLLMVMDIVYIILILLLVNANNRWIYYGSLRSQAVRNHGIGWETSSSSAVEIFQGDGK